jgi:hypothetical protein
VLASKGEHSVSDESSNRSIPIIVAIIGVAGGIGGTILGNWGKLPFQSSKSESLSGSVPDKATAPHSYASSAQTPAHDADVLSADELAHPCEAPILHSKYMAISGFPAFEIGISSCKTISPTRVACSFVLTSKQPGIASYKSDPDFWRSKMIDNRNSAYPLSLGYFLDFAGTHKRTVDLPQGQCAWLVQEFSGDADGATQATVAFNLRLWYGQAFTLQANVLSQDKN